MSPVTTISFPGRVLILCFRRLHHACISTFKWKGKHPNRIIDFHFTANPNINVIVYTAIFLPRTATLSNFHHIVPPLHCHFIYLISIALSFHTSDNLCGELFPCPKSVDAEIMILIPLSSSDWEQPMQLIYLNSSR